MSTGKKIGPLSRHDFDGVTPNFVEVGADPSVSPGLALPPGSIAKFGAAYFMKTDEGATDWSPTPFGTGGGGSVDSVDAGTGIAVDNTDPANPIVSNEGVLTFQVEADGPLYIIEGGPQNPLLGWQGEPGAPIDASYLLLGNHAGLTDDRVFTPGAGLSGADSGAGNPYTLSVNLANSAPPAIAAVAAVGVSTDSAREDHTHAGVQSVNGELGAVVLFADKQLWSDQLDLPVTADWAVNSPAPAGADSVNSGLTIRSLADSGEPGVGFIQRLPVGSGELGLDVVLRALAAPGAARTLGLKLYARRVQMGVAVSAWQSLVLADVAIPTNAFFLMASYGIAFAAFSTPLEDGEIYQFQLTRIAPTAGTNLTGNANLLYLGVSVSA